MDEQRMRKNKKKIENKEALLMTIERIQKGEFYTSKDAARLIEEKNRQQDLGLEVGNIEHVKSNLKKEVEELKLEQSTRERVMKRRRDELERFKQQQRIQQQKKLEQEKELEL